MAIFLRKTPQFLKRGDGLLNSESMGKQFGQSDVYDNSAIKLNRNRIPCSRARGGNSARKGKWTGRKGQMEVNRAGERDNPGDCDNHHSQVENENEGDDDYQDNWGGIGLAM